MISLIGSSSSILLRARLHFPSPNKLKLWSSASSSSSVACCSSSSSSHHHHHHHHHHLQPPDVAQLADTARIALSPKEVEDFAPKIRQVVDWFGQLQAVDLESVEPSLQAALSFINLVKDTTENIKTGYTLKQIAIRDTEVISAPREDIPETFGNRDAILAEIPSFTEPYIKVPKVLNKE